MLFVLYGLIACLYFLSMCIKVICNLGLIFFFFNQKAAFYITVWLEFKRVLFRFIYVLSSVSCGIFHSSLFYPQKTKIAVSIVRKSAVKGKSEDLGLRGTIRKKKSTYMINVTIQTLQYRSVCIGTVNSSIISSISN